jgi:hypothetical protein
MARFIPPPDGERNRNDRWGLPRRALDENPCSSEERRASMTAVMLFLTVSVFMLTSLEWLPAAGPRSRIVLAHVFADVV